MIEGETGYNIAPHLRDVSQIAVDFRLVAESKGILAVDLKRLVESLFRLIEASTQLEILAQGVEGIGGFTRREIVIAGFFHRAPEKPTFSSLR